MAVAPGTERACRPITYVVAGCGRAVTVRLLRTNENGRHGVNHTAADSTDMHYKVEVNGRSRRVDVMRTGDVFAVEVDGHRRQVDVARIDANTLSLLIGDLPPEGGGRPDLHGRSASYEVVMSQAMASGSALGVHVGTSPVAVTLIGRRRKADAGHGRAAGGAGRALRVVAPMPGKVVRVLVAAGAAVTVRQPLVVVEAMKMENELRAGRDGRVTAIHVREGASVDAGTLLIELE